jgi:hypothetical protein
MHVLCIVSLSVCEANSSPDFAVCVCVCVCLSVKASGVALALMDQGPSVTSQGVIREAGTAARVLCAYLDFEAGYRVEGGCQTTNLLLQGLRLESTVNLSDNSSVQQTVRPLRPSVLFMPRQPRAANHPGFLPLSPGHQSCCAPTAPPTSRRQSISVCNGPPG